MTEVQHCPRCHRPLPANAPSGLCRHCLYGRLIQEEQQSDAAVNDDGALGEFGDYELIELLAHGGMGVVYRARHRRLNRTVALKMIRAGEFASDADQKRFRAEAEAAAQLDHPNIVPIYEVGELEAQEYFSMKLMEGGALSEWISNHHGQDSSRETAQMLVKIARAVHYAHQRGVLHRDLKPGNVLLNGLGEVFLTDFGLAKRIESSLNLTVSGAVLGTPNYMAPEQAVGGSKEVTTAADIYGLGTILYELLTGRPPFQATTALATMRAVIEDEPRRPSSVAQEVDRDLETICLKCLEKEPSRRYHSAEAFADDLERWLRDEPILARPSTAWETAAKWARRHPARAGLLGMMIVAPSALAVVLLISTARIDRQKNMALRAQRVAENEKRRAENSERSAREQGYASDIFAASQALQKDDLAYARRIIDTYLDSTTNGGGFLDAETKALLGFEWRLLWQRTRGEFIGVATNPIAPALCLTFSPDGHALLAGGADGLRQWHLQDGKPSEPLRIADHQSPGSKRVVSMAFADAGRKLLVAGDKEVDCWSYPQMELQFLLPEPQAQLSVSADGSTVAMGLWNEEEQDPTPSAHPFSVALLDLKTASVTKVLPGYGHRVAISPDGEWVLSGSRSNGVAIWHPETGRLIKIKRDHGRGGMSFSPDSSLVALGGWQKSLHVLEVADLSLRASFAGYQLGVLSMAWTPDAANIFSVGLDQTVKLWGVPATARPHGPTVLPDRADHPALHTFFGHQSPVSTLALSADGKWMASGSLDQKILIWNVEGVLTPTNPVVLPEGTGNRRLEPVSGCVITYSNTALAIWNSREALASARVLPGTDGLLDIGSVSGGSNFVAFHPSQSGVTGFVETRSLPEGRVLSRVDVAGMDVMSAGIEGEPLKATISPDGRWLAAAANRPCRAWLYDLRERRSQTPEPAWSNSSNGVVQRILFSPDSRWLVWTQEGLNDSSITILDMASMGRPLLVRLAGEPESVTGAVIDPTSHFLATGGTRQNSICIWELANGRLLGSCNDNCTQGGLAWSPDGRTLATVGYLGLKLWNTIFYRELLNLEPRSAFIPCGFTADGRTLISCTQQGQVRLDTAPTLDEILNARQ